MKKVTALLSIIGAVVLVAMAIGCASTKQTENLLSAAGFKMVPADTPQRQAHLKTLPPKKVTMTQRDGQTYFVYPDPAHNVLYVGQQAQYQPVSEPARAEPDGPGGIERRATQRRLGAVGRVVSQPDSAFGLVSG